MPARHRILCLLTLCATVLGACTPHVNLASRRRAYDALLDLAGRGAAVAAEDQGLLADLQAHSSTPLANPYPSMRADVDAQARQVASLQRGQESLQGLLKELDSLASGRLSLSPDDGPAWLDYQDLDQRYRPLEEAMEQQRQALEDAHQDFQSLLRRYGIGHEEADALRSEAQGFLQALDRSLNSMEAKVRDERTLFETYRQMGGPRELMRLRRMALDGLEQDLIDAESYQRKASSSARLFMDGLPATGPLYSGPGLPGDGSAVLRLRDDRDDLDRRVAAFQDECRHFEHIDSEPYYNPPSTDPSLNPQPTAVPRLP